MADRHNRSTGPAYEDGAQPVEEHPGDQPGPGRGPAFVVVALLALASLAMPVAWGIGVLTSVGEHIGEAALTGIWIVWGIVVLLFAWSLWAMWRAAA